MRNALRILPAVLLASLFGIGLATGVARDFSLTALKAHHHELHLYAIAHPVGAAAVFVGLFVAAVASGLPIALILTVASGTIFGPPIGMGLTMFSATVGATLTYGAARMAVGSRLEARMERMGGRMRRLIEGFERNTFAHILTMRLIPLFPFSPVNIAAGLARVPLRPFVLATLVGEVPTALIYTSFGAGLGRALNAGGKPGLANLQDPWLVAPMAGLALLSLAPSAIARWNRRRGSTPSP